VRFRTCSAAGDATAETGPENYGERRWKERTGNTYDEMNFLGQGNMDRLKVIEPRFGAPQVI
jgi:hypothetical protein